MKLFLCKKICRALFIGLIGLSLNAQAGLLNPTVTLDGDGLAKAIDVVLEKRIQQLQTGTAAVLDQGQKALTAQLDSYYPKAKNDATLLANRVLNELRLAPVCGVGTAFIVASIYMYQKALNDYFDTIDTKEEALQALRKKIKWKTIAGSAFLSLGIATFYKSETIAQLCLGYKPA